jgi:hypothetical protein
MSSAIIRKKETQLQDTNQHANYSEKKGWTSKEQTNAVATAALSKIETPKPSSSPLTTANAVNIIPEVRVRNFLKQYTQAGFPAPTAYHRPMTSNQLNAYAQIMLQPLTLETPVQTPFFSEGKSVFQDFVTQCEGNLNHEIINTPTPEGLLPFRPSLEFQSCFHVVDSSMKGIVYPKKKHTHANVNVLKSFQFSIQADAADSQDIHVARKHLGDCFLKAVLKTITDIYTSQQITFTTFDPEKFLHVKKAIINDDQCLFLYSIGPRIGKTLDIRFVLNLNIKNLKTHTCVLVPGDCSSSAFICDDLKVSTAGPCISSVDNSIDLVFGHISTRLCLAYPPKALTFPILMRRISGTENFDTISSLLQHLSIFHNGLRFPEELFQLHLEKALKKHPLQCLASFLNYYTILGVSLTPSAPEMNSYRLLSSSLEKQQEVVLKIIPEGIEIPNPRLFIFTLKLMLSAQSIENHHPLSISSPYFLQRLESETGEAFQILLPEMILPDALIILRELKTLTDERQSLCKAIAPVYFFLKEHGLLLKSQEIPKTNEDVLATLDHLFSRIFENLYVHISPVSIKRQRKSLYFHQDFLFPTMNNNTAKALTGPLQDLDFPSYWGLLPSFPNRLSSLNRVFSLSLVNLSVKLSKEELSAKKYLGFLNEVSKEIGENLAFLSLDQLKLRISSTEGADVLARTLKEEEEAIEGALVHPNKGFLSVAQHLLWIIKPLSPNENRAHKFALIVTQVKLFCLDANHQSEVIDSFITYLNLFGLDLSGSREEIINHPEEIEYLLFKAICEQKSSDSDFLICLQSLMSKLSPDTSNRRKMIRDANFALLEQSKDPKKNLLIQRYLTFKIFSSFRSCAPVDSEDSISFKTQLIALEALSKRELPKEASIGLNAAPTNNHPSLNGIIPESFDWTFQELKNELEGEVFTSVLASDDSSSNEAITRNFSWILQELEKSLNSLEKNATKAAKEETIKRTEKLISLLYALYTKNLDKKIPTGLQEKALLLIIKSLKSLNTKVNSHEKSFQSLFFCLIKLNKKLSEAEARLVLETLKDLLSSSYVKDSDLIFQASFNILQQSVFFEASIETLSSFLLSLSNIAIQKEDSDGFSRLLDLFKEKLTIRERITLLSSLIKIKTLINKKKNTLSPIALKLSASFKNVLNELETVPVNKLDQGVDKKALTNQMRTSWLNFLGQLPSIPEDLLEASFAILNSPVKNWKENNTQDLLLKLSSFAIQKNTWTSLLKLLNHIKENIPTKERATFLLELIKSKELLRSGKGIPENLSLELSSIMIETLEEIIPLPLKQFSHKTDKEVLIINLKKSWLNYLESLSTFPEGLAVNSFFILESPLEDWKKNDTENFLVSILNLVVQKSDWKSFSELLNCFKENIPAENRTIFLSFLYLIKSEDPNAPVNKIPDLQILAFANFFIHTLNEIKLDSKINRKSLINYCRSVWLDFLKSRLAFPDELFQISYLVFESPEKDWKENNIPAFLLTLSNVAIQKGKWKGLIEILKYYSDKIAEKELASLLLEVVKSKALKDSISKISEIFTLEFSLVFAKTLKETEALPVSCAFPEEEKKSLVSNLRSSWLTFLKDLPKITEDLFKISSGILKLPPESSCQESDIQRRVSLLKLKAKSSLNLLEKHHLSNLYYQLSELHKHPSFSESLRLEASTKDLLKFLYKEHFLHALKENQVLFLEAFELLEAYSSFSPRCREVYQEILENANKEFLRCCSTMSEEMLREEHSLSFPEKKNCCTFDHLVAILNKEAEKEPEQATKESSKLLLSLIQKIKELPLAKWSKLWLKLVTTPGNYSLGKDQGPLFIILLEKGFQEKDTTSSILLIKSFYTFFLEYPFNSESKKKLSELCISFLPKHFEILNNKEIEEKIRDDFSNEMNACILSNSFLSAVEYCSENHLDLFYDESKTVVLLSSFHALSSPPTTSSSTVTTALIPKDLAIRLRKFAHHLRERLKGASQVSPALTLFVNYSALVIGPLFPIIDKKTVSFRNAQSMCDLLANTSASLNIIASIRIQLCRYQSSRMNRIAINFMEAGLLVASCLKRSFYETQDLLRVSIRENKANFSIQLLGEGFNAYYHATSRKAYKSLSEDTVSGFEALNSLHAPSGEFFRICGTYVATFKTIPTSKEYILNQIANCIKIQEEFTQTAVYERKIAISFLMFRTITKFIQGYLSLPNSSSKEAVALLKQLFLKLQERGATAFMALEFSPEHRDTLHSSRAYFYLFQAFCSHKDPINDPKAHNPFILFLYNELIKKQGPLFLIEASKRNTEAIQALEQITGTHFLKDAEKLDQKTFPLANSIRAGIISLKREFEALKTK